MNFVTKQAVKQFKDDQENYGTEVAMTNLLAEISFELLKGVNVKKMSLRYRGGGKRGVVLGDQA